MSYNNQRMAQQMQARQGYHAHPQACGCGCQPKQQVCSLPHAPPKRIACQPAPFSSGCAGGKYHAVIHAYGSSTFAKDWY